MIKNIFGFSLATIVMCSLYSCNSISCEEYYDKFADEAFKKNIIEWSDSQIFGKKFDSTDFIIGRLIGPGDPRSTFSNSSKKIKFPESINGYEIRVMNNDKYNPEAIFFGKRNFQGFVVTRLPINSYSDGRVVKIGKLDKQDERIGVVCVSHFR
jgi:hypothetical protein